MKRTLLSCIVILGSFALCGVSPLFAQTPTQGAPDAVATTSTSPAPVEQPSAEVVPPVAVTERDGAYERAIVEGVRQREEQTPTGGRQVEAYTIRFLSGALDGEARDIVNDVGSNPYGIQPRKGDKVVIFIQSAVEGGQQFYIEGYDRRAAMIWLVVLFFAVLVLLAGWQGFKVAASITISIALIGYVLIPSFLRGVNPIPVAIALSGVFTLVSSGFSMGWNRKTYVTVVGTIGGALIAYLISWVFADWAHLNGLSTEEDRLFFGQNPNLDPRGLLFAGIIIASAGVVEDVAVSIVSGLAEVKRANPRLAFRQLFQAGMTIGNDHMSALANTLIYAYVGGSLSTLLLYTQFGGSWLKFINFDSVVDEVIRSLSGTIGLIFTVPISALLGAWFFQKRTVSQEEAKGGHGGHAGHVH